MYLQKVEVRNRWNINNPPPRGHPFDEEYVLRYFARVIDRRGGGWMKIRIFAVQSSIDGLKRMNQTEKVQHSKNTSMYKGSGSMPWEPIEEGIPLPAGIQALDQM